jgi:hypothetical protein
LLFSLFFAGNYQRATAPSPQKSWISTMVRGTKQREKNGIAGITEKSREVQENVPSRQFVDK